MGMIYCTIDASTMSVTDDRSCGTIERRRTLVCDSKDISFNVLSILVSETGRKEKNGVPPMKAGGMFHRLSSLVWHQCP